jgi:hypothetical protein
MKVSSTSIFNELPCRHFDDVTLYLRRDREEMSFWDETLLAQLLTRNESWN